MSVTSSFFHNKNSWPDCLPAPWGPGDVETWPYLNKTYGESKVDGCYKHQSNIYKAIHTNIHTPWMNSNFNNVYSVFTVFLLVSNHWNPFWKGNALDSSPNPRLSKKITLGAIGTEPGLPTNQKSAKARQCHPSWVAKPCHPATTTDIHHCRHPHHFHIKKKKLDQPGIHLKRMKKNHAKHKQLNIKSSNIHSAKQACAPRRQIAVGCCTSSEFPEGDSTSTQQLGLISASRTLLFFLSCSNVGGADIRVYSTVSMRVT